MRTLVSAVVLVLAAPVCMAQTFSTPSDNGPTTAPKKPISFDLSSIDKTADPCTDFYQYACGNWMKANPIPSDQVRWGRFNELSERNNYLLYTELKSAADAPKTALQRQYGDFFAACMNTTEVDKLGVNRWSRSWRRLPRSRAPRTWRRSTPSRSSGAGAASSALA